MIQAIVLFPLLGFLIAGLFGRVIGARASEIVTTGLLMASAVMSWIVFIKTGYGEGGKTLVLGNWFTSGNLSVDWAFRVDTLTAVMLVVVNSVSALVHL